MKSKNKKEVFKVYDKIINWFDSHRNKDLIMERSYMDFILQHSPANATVLDVGCGTGEPIGKFFIENGCDVTGIDASKEMIKTCQQRFPNQCWILEDMRTLNLQEEFDIVIAWHSFFHLPHDDQSPTLKLFANHLKAKGLLIFTSGPEHSEVWSDNGGHELYHASLSSDEYEEILLENNLQIRMHNVKDQECGDATVWIAQKK